MLYTKAKVAIESNKARHFRRGLLVATIFPCGCHPASLAFGVAESLFVSDIKRCQIPAKVYTDLL